MTLRIPSGLSDTWSPPRSLAEAERDAELRNLLGERSRILNLEIAGSRFLALAESVAADSQQPEVKYELTRLVTLIREAFDECVTHGAIPAVANAADQVRGER